MRLIISFSCPTSPGGSLYIWMISRISLIEKPSRFPRMIKIAGGEPANFLDIGGGASPERVAKSFRAVLGDKNVETILVNIFAGINRCDWVAEGVIKAIREVGVTVPLVVRLSGTKAEEGRRILADSGEAVIVADTLAEAAEKAVAAWRAATKKKAA